MFICKLIHLEKIQNTGKSVEKCLLTFSVILDQARGKYERVSSDLFHNINEERQHEYILLYIIRDC